MEEKFFDWLRSYGQIDRYEALLDIYDDYYTEQLERIHARDEIDKIKNWYELEKFRKEKILKIKNEIQKG